MNHIVAAKQMNAAEIAEAVLVKGDLAKLTPDERNAYYFRICESVGLNPLTKPFEYLILNGKMRLYALKDCTDQLRSVHNVSVTEMTETEREGVFIVTCKVMNGAGRTDVSKGAVNIAGLKGENLANALMKAETKAKRRATLSICGLGMLDETEVEDIPANQKQAVVVPSASPPPAAPATKQVAPPPVDPEPSKYKVRAPRGTTASQWSEMYIELFMQAESVEELDKYDEANDGALRALQEKHNAIYVELYDKYERHQGFLQARAEMAAEGPAEGAEEAKSEAAPSKPAKATKPKKGEQPDLAANYEGWLEWAKTKLAESADVEIAQTFFDTMIESRRSEIMPPDFGDLQDAYQAVEKRLTSE